MKFIRRITKKEDQVLNSKDAAKERLHLVLMQDRANVSADFLELMKQEIIEVIKKYIDVDETAIDVRLTNKENADGTKGAPALYANIPIMNIKDEGRHNNKTDAEVNTTSEESTIDTNAQKEEIEETKAEEIKNDEKICHNKEELGEQKGKTDEKQEVENL
jgi:cell division topological specificity factor